MMQAATGHPALERLCAFGHGRLAADDMAAIEAHVADCEACCQQLEDLDDDGLIVLVQESHAMAPEEPNEALASTAGFPQSDAATTEPGLPPELVEHPRYRIIRWIGTGGMGTVYEAEHRLMKNKVAVKVIKRDLLHRSELVERFNQEMESFGKLGTHPNIVVGHNAEQAGSCHFLVLEFVEGESLLDHVKARGPLPVPRACEYTRQAALGLQHAWDRRMVHRDIKPANLMVTPDGRIKILDFGLARFAREAASDAAPEDAADMGLTEPGMVIGTYDFMAPEQAYDPHTADIRADIYSLGCTLYFFLTGRRPFPRGAGIQQIRLHETRSPEPLDRLRPEVPPQLTAVLDRMMAKKPAERYQTPAEVARALEPFARTEAGPPTAPATPPKPEALARIPTGAKAQPRARRLIGPAVTVTLLVALLAVILVLRAPRMKATRLVRLARTEMATREEASVQRAAELFARAITSDPSYVPAYTGQAACYTLLGDYGWLSAQDASAKAKAAAQTALRLDPSSAEAHAALGLILSTFDREWAEAGRELREAMRLDPGYAEARHWYAWYLAQLGRFDEARQFMTIASVEDPNSYIIETNQGKILYYAGRFDEAIAHFQLVLKLREDYSKAIMDLALAYEQAGKYEEALGQLEILNRRSRTEGISRLVARGRIYARMGGRRAEAQAILEDLLKRREDRQTYVSPYSIATLHVALGTNDEAFEMLEAAWEESDTGLSYLKVDPRLKPLRSDPRFQAHLRRAGFP
jgi:Tfp pilus assembly protein PilF